MSLPVVDPPTEGTGAARVAGVVLASGTSSRFGDANKLLARVDGDPIVGRSVDTVREAGLDPVVVVVGYDAKRVRATVENRDVTAVYNPDFEAGQATSVRTGVRALPEVDAAVFMLGDMPFVSPATVGALVAAYEAGEGSALAAGCDGDRGNPVLFDARHFERLEGCTGDSGGRAVLLSASDAAIVETGDPGVRRDVDRPDDL